MNMFFPILLICVKVSLGHERLLKLKKIQSDGTLDGLGCAMDDPMKQSGGKFDTTTKSCTRLPRNWFRSPTLEATANYFKIVNFERFGPRNSMITENIPPITLSGGSIQLFVTSSNNPQTGRAWVYLMNNDKTITMSHIMDRDSWCVEDGRPEICSANPITQPNTDYKYVLRFMNSYVKIYINNTLANELQPMDHDLYQILTFINSRLQPLFLVKRILFLY